MARSPTSRRRARTCGRKSRTTERKPRSRAGSGRGWRDDRRSLPIGLRARAASPLPRRVARTARPPTASTTPGHAPATAASRSGSTRSSAAALGQAAKSGADLPEPPRDLRIAPVARRQPRPVPYEVPAGHTVHLGRAGQVDRSARPFFLADEEGARERHRETQEPALVEPESARHRAGVERVGGDARALEPARQLAREEDVGELGLRVGAPAVVMLFALQVVEIDPPDLR